MGGGGWTTFPFILNRGWLICTCSKVAGMDVVRENIYLSGFLKCKLGLRCPGMKLTQVYGICLRKVLMCACSRLIQVKCCMKRLLHKVTSSI